MVAYQLDSSRRLTVFFEDQATRRANERASTRLDPRRRCLISAAAFIARGDAMGMVPLRHSLPSEENHEIRARSRKHHRLVFYRARDISSVRPRDVIRMIDYAEPREPKG